MIQVKPQDQPDIEEQHEDVSKRERRMCSEKITIPKDVCLGEIDIERLPWCAYRRNFY